MGRFTVISIEEILKKPYPAPIQVGNSASSWVIYDEGTLDYWYGDCLIVSLEAVCGDKIMIHEGVSAIKMQKPKDPIQAEFWKRNCWTRNRKTRLIDVAKEAYERTRFDKVFHSDVPSGVCFISEDSKIAVYYQFDCCSNRVIYASWYLHESCVLEEVQKFFFLIDENGVYPCSFILDAIKIVTKDGLLSELNDYRRLPTWFRLLVIRL